ncbi:hypothetical protein AGMMS50268_10020 [Spirochaetia bacterium]|nr:hypothetical protein AGMMS50268_10020 [Spirochaetia bacterium]
MKKKSPRARCVLSLILLFSIAALLPAQNFKGLTFLKVIETRHFEIIYPPESEQTARALARTADGTYERISALLGIQLRGKVPVTITPHTDQLNSYMNAQPYPHIVLFDTPMDPESFIFTNSLEGIFLHELTHAVSLSSRGPFFETLHRIFGGWVYPTALTAPQFMVEGVSVSFESLEGFGRAPDPLTRQGLRQAIHENAFLSPYQAAGASDLPAALSAHYEYGGLFSQYLQNTYGMEKYARLWQEMGASYHFSFFFYNNGFFHAFKKVYGIPVPRAWEHFRQSLALGELEDNSGGMIRRRGQALITGLAAAGDRVFILNQTGRQLAVYNSKTGKTERTFPMDVSAYDISVSAEGFAGSSAAGDRFLVSSYGYENSRSEAVVAEYHTGNGLPGRVWKGLYRGAYFRDGVVGLSSDRHSNSIVFRSGEKGAGEETLLRGNAALLFTSPRPLNDTWIAFIVSRRGNRELGLFNYKTRQAYCIASDLEDDEQRWRYIRCLQFSQGHLLFAYDHDDRMYKLGSIDLTDLPAGNGAMPGELRAVFTDRDFSGAVSLPVIAGDRIYYRGAFTNRDALMIYPEKAGELSGLHAPLRLVPWDQPEPASDPAVDHSITAEPPGTMGGTETGAGSITAEKIAGAIPGKAYFPLKYLNPFKFWLPLPLIRDSISLDGAGIFSLILDPAETNLINLNAAMDFRFQMADINIAWTNRGLGFPLGFTFSDTIDRTGTSAYRATRTGLSGVFTRSLGSQGLRGSLSAGTGVSFFAADYERSGTAAYTWKYDQDPQYSITAGAGLSTLRRFPWETFGSGFSLDFHSRFVLEAGQAAETRNPRIDGVLGLAFEPFFPAQLHLYGSWDKWGMKLRGTSRQYADTLYSAVAATEYPSDNIDRLQWLSGGEAEVRVFSLNVQRSLSHLYLNRVFGTLAYRGALYDGQGLLSPQGNKMGEKELRFTQSLIFRLAASSSTIFITSMPVRFTPILWGAWKISNAGNGVTDFADDFRLGFYYNLQY